MTCGHKKLLLDTEFLLREVLKDLQRERFGGRPSNKTNRVQLLLRRLRESLAAPAEEFVTAPPQGEPLPAIFVKGRKQKESVGA